MYGDKYSILGKYLVSYIIDLGNLICMKRKIIVFLLLVTLMVTYQGEQVLDPSIEKLGVDFDFSSYT